LKKIKMNHSTQGSPDGMRVLNYQKNYEYEVPDGLATAFITMGAAKAVGARERKAVRAAPENAAMSSAPENAAQKPKPPKPEEGPVIRVYQLAEELDLPSKKVMDAARKIGIFTRAPASGLSDDEVKRIKKVLKKK
jgi:hypothetical protein